MEVSFGNRVNKNKKNTTQNIKPMKKTFNSGHDEKKKRVVKCKRRKNDEGIAIDTDGTILQSDKIIVKRRLSAK